ncbi:MAG TPA: NAD(P)-dependent oxidoreductase [Usitatibacter sp.]|nr:NAD(P)-dependent oxidoreductase [Usitatibacter sp.]
MKVLLTGASGFVGSYVLRQLLAVPGAEVGVLLRDPERAWRIQADLPRTTILRASLDDVAALEAAVSGFAASHVVHLAWSGVLGKDRNDASQRENTRRSVRLLETAATAGARHFIGLGSQAEYGPCEAKIDESTPTAPTTLYGAAKLSTCHMAAGLCERYGLRFAWLRLFSSYGPQDSPEWMIPYLALKLLHRERPAVTAAEQLWDYIYVDDAAAAIASVVRSEHAAGIFNLGSGTAPRLRDIIEMVRDAIDPSLPIGFGEVPYRPDQVMHLEADIGRLRRATGWEPRVPLPQGIRQTVEWYAKHDAGH